ncbi:DAK2 domain-containing protein [Pseudoramibacter sp.]|jgi:DAK2 domain fusion protein YloV|uniref:DAK2 domain-containing protein n=1 Tax=Pseudoramibacter sp. TaxID=2034862 RepID=UPI0025EB373A|nr:DAK2 domain-containing protein [Pseudoramibacter sp.]MCH4071962.1 DAK2 domain-containing protein [Pseudoramibacter sp.]MCH4105730.1 DAK2 domain-containing protein [Pseudoramibacter sp.]
MEIQKIDGAMLRKMFEYGAQNLEIYKKNVDELNVFPVPDGDTGTNMSMTFANSIRELNKLKNDELYAVSKTASSGALFGARGNSGVILSQLLRGLARANKGHKTLDVKGVAEGIKSAADTAYKAVMKPTEGTILTVAWEMSEFAQAHYKEYDDILSFLNDVLAQGQDALRRTPEMLPVLKEAGVVDSGGQGLIYIVEGAVKGLAGKELEKAVTLQPSERERFVDDSNMKPEDITYGYCTEFIVKHAKDADENALRDYLSTIGDCVLVIKDDDLIKVHVHTDHPGKAFEKGLTMGTLTRMKVDNMREMLGVPDEEEAEEPQGDPVPYGFVAVSPGDGLSEIFKELGVTRVISGGQTMNPSTEDFTAEIKKINADHIFLFPNNGNIIMAANQAAEMSDKDVRVIPSKTIPQCITAMLSFDADVDCDANEKAMDDVLATVKTGEVTYAVRNTKIDGKAIAKGDIMGISEGEIKTVGTDVNDVTEKLIDQLIDPESELISIYYGNGLKKEDTESLVEAVEQRYDDCDVEVSEGAQPLYYYIVSVE